VVRAQESERHLLYLGQIELLLDFFLQEERRLFVLEVLAQVLFNLVEDLSSCIGVQSQQLAAKLSHPLLVRMIAKFDEFVLGITPLFVTLQIHKLLKDECVLCVCN
jgi:hypothetical protein